MHTLNCSLPQAGSHSSSRAELLHGRPCPVPARGKTSLHLAGVSAGNASSGTGRQAGASSVQGWQGTAVACLQQQRGVNQPAASVTELRAHRKELRRGKGFSFMKETSGLIESGSSPAARDRPRCLIHISCLAVLWQQKAQCKRRGSPAWHGENPGSMRSGRGEGSQGLSRMWAGAVGGTCQPVRDVPGKLEAVLTRFRFWPLQISKASGWNGSLCLLKASPGTWIWAVAPQCC